jgi:hypothetical protein
MVFRQSLTRFVGTETTDLMTLTPSILGVFIANRLDDSIKVV